MKYLIIVFMIGAVGVGLGCLLFITGSERLGHIWLAAGGLLEVVAVALLLVRTLRNKVTT